MHHALRDSFDSHERACQFLYETFNDLGGEYMETWGREVLLSNLSNHEYISKLEY
jgi:hypothetical protein